MKSSNNMALFNSSAISFEDVRLILCVHGYTIEDNFVCREIGYWSRNFNGSLPVSCRINVNKLSSKDKTTVKYLYTQFHGINIRKQSEFSLLQNEVKSAIKSLYLLADDGKDRKYIGVCRDVNAFSLCHSVGLQYLTVNMEKLKDCSKESKIPSNEDLITLLNNKFHPYINCVLHDNLENDRPPLCAGVKAKFLADFFVKNCIVNMKVNDKFSQLTEL